MRTFLFRFALLVLLASLAFAQQSSQSASTTQPKGKHPSTEAQAQTKAQEAPSEKPTPSPTVNPPEKMANAPDESKAGDKDKEERFDVTEVAPVVTHHQVT